MPELRSCRVSYQDSDGIRHSVEVTAETLYEAAVVGMTTLRAAGWMDAPNLTIEVTVKAPETHTRSTAAYSPRGFLDPARARESRRSSLGFLS